MGTLKTQACLAVATALFCWNAHAATISNNLANLTEATEVATGSTWLAASFGAGPAASSLASVTLLLSSTVAGTAALDLYSNSLLEPGSRLASFTPPPSYSTTLAPTTFTAAGVSLAANSTYWLVLRAVSGDFGWAWTASSSGTGVGFQHTWGFSPNSGTNWFTIDAFPLQFSVDTTSSDTVVPEPGGFLLAAAVLASLWLVHRRKHRHSCGA